MIEWVMPMGRWKGIVITHLVHNQRKSAKNLHDMKWNIQICGDENCFFLWTFTKKIMIGTGRLRLYCSLRCFSPFIVGWRDVVGHLMHMHALSIDWLSCVHHVKWIYVYVQCTDSAGHNWKLEGKEAKLAKIDWDSIKHQRVAIIERPMTLIVSSPRRIFWMEVHHFCFVQFSFFSRFDPSYIWATNMSSFSLSSMILVCGELATINNYVWT